LAPFCSAAVRPLGVAYRKVVVLLEIVAVVGLVELEFPPADIGVAVERMRRAPSGLSGVFARSFVAPANKDLTSFTFGLIHLQFNLSLIYENCRQ
jgi:hypothetical protein